jgi:hypothetical protein
MLRGLESQVTATAQGRPEFSLPVASRKVRRNKVTRTMRVAAASVGVGAVIGVGVWTLMGQFNHNQPAVTSPSPSALVAPTLTTSVSPTPTVRAVAATPLGHNPAMDDSEALLRAEQPTTGEQWLSSPQHIDAPSWAGETNANCEWLLVGSRGDRDIMITVGACDTWFFEAGASGEGPTVVVAPFPYEDPAAQSARYGEPTFFMDPSSFPAVRIDSDTYYDSLSLPSAWTAADGVAMRRADAGFFGDPGAPGYISGGPAYSSFVATTGASFGDSAFVRVDAPADQYNWYDTTAEFNSWLGGNATVRLEGVKLPFGVYLVSFSGHVPEAVAGSGYWAGSFFDNGCSTSPDYGAVVTDPDLSTWVQIGTMQDAPVYAPTQDNPLATGMWAAWTKYNETLAPSGHPTSVSLADYLAAPAIIATPTADGSGWWLGYNWNFRMRNWC